MRTIKANLLGLALAGLILGACSQTGTYETADLMNEQAAAEKAGFKLDPFGMINENARTYSDTDCEAFCIDPANPEYSVKTATISNNSGPQTRVFTYSVYNTLTGFELNWNYAASNNAGRKLKITVSGAGFSSPRTYISSQLNGGPASGSNTFAFDASWAACGVVTVVAEILDGNNLLVSGPISSTYSLIGECSSCDDASFSYETEDDQNIVFTYNHGAEVTNLTIEFTFPQVLNLPLNGEGKYVAPDGKIYSVNNPTNQTNFTWTGFVSCDEDEASTFEFSMAPDCGKGNPNDGQSIIWTDAKIIAVNGVDLVDNPETLDENEGPYSLKGNLSNIVYEGCPTRN